MSIIAVDFDGTLCTHEFPRIGVEVPYAIDTLKSLQKRGHKVFLWSMRGHPDLSRFDHTNQETGEYIEQDTLLAALKWCEERGLVFNGVNRSPAQFSTSPKQYAQVYIDDAALGCPLRYLYDTGSRRPVVDWGEVAECFVKMGLITQQDYSDIIGGRVE